MNSILEEKNTKKCSKCNEVKELKYFFYRTDSNKYRNQCRKCNKGYSSLREDKIIESDKLFKEGKKKCTKCNKIKNIDEFSSCKSSRNGLYSRCKNCVNEHNKTNKKERKKSAALRRYNLSSKEYDDLMEIKECQICNISIDDNNRHIDHCHESGKFKGVLCDRCNIGLGHFKDDKVILNKAIKYLEIN